MLRTLSARHSFRHDALNVLCDSSFLKCLLRLEEVGGSDVPHLRGSQRAMKRGGSGEGGTARGVRQDPFLLLKSLTVQSLEATRKPGERHGHDQAANTNERTRATSKQLANIQWCYLPATMTVLQRWSAAEDSLHPSSTSGAVMRLLSRLTDLTAGGETQVDSAPPPFLSPHTNEAKAIAGYLSFQAERRAALYRGEDPKPEVLAASPSPGRSTFTFVATQNHDVRRLLPPETALLRLTHPPAAIWVEVRGDSYHYDTPGEEVVKAAPHKKVFKGPKPSDADVAFMRFLGKGPADTASEGKTPVSVASRKKRPRAAGHHANPLAVKKKSKKDVIRL